MRIGFLPLTTLGLMALAACQPVTDDKPVDLFDVETGYRWPSVDIGYIEMDAPYVRIGTDGAGQGIKSLALGQDSATVDGLLGAPEVVDGNTRFYSLSFPYRGQDDLVCQYAAVFDDDRLVDGGWRRMQCTSFAG